MSNTDSIKNPGVARNGKVITML